MSSDEESEDERDMKSTSKVHKSPKAHVKHSPKYDAVNSDVNNSYNNVNSTTCMSSSDSDAEAQPKSHN
ncbi:WSSV332 [White spot syndrome virus]|nr:WSSV332 [White spot syndrome virus]